MMLSAGMAALALLSAPAASLASGGQVAIFSDGAEYSDPQGTLATMRLLGAQMVRVNVYWSQIAPSAMSRRRPAGFNAADPAAYPAGKWSDYDQLAYWAQRYGMKVDFTVVGGLGAPLWADGAGAPRGYYPEWKPSAREFGLFVRAVGTRYSGSYPDPAHPGSSLPRVNFWGLWNEPNFGEDLAPQAINGSSVSVAPGMYRSLVDAAWSSLGATGHGHDTILIGELAARGLSGGASRSHPEGLPGNFAQTKPLQFIRTLYCVDSNYHQYTGAAAAARGCPTTSAGYRGFRNAHPGLFQASGFDVHPYPQNLPPTQEASKDPDYVAFNEIPRLEGVLDRLQRQYGSRTQFPIWNDEYGYVTNPPNRGNYVSPATAAYYINWAEYLSWRSPRIKSTDQFLLKDPPATGGALFASGLEFINGTPKATFDAYRLPLYLPATSGKHGRSLEVWGAARPAYYASLDTGGTPQVVQIQFMPSSGGGFTTLKTATAGAGNGYFDTHVTFPSSGTVRLAWTYPLGFGGGTVFSRSVQVTIK